MFYALVIGTMIGFSLQNVLLVKYARRMDTLSLSLYRNIALGILMLPLLFLAGDEGDVFSALSYWPRFVLIGVMGGLFLTFIYKSYAYIAVGLASTFSKAFIIVLTTVLGWLLIGDEFSVVTTVMITLLMLSSLWLAFIKNHLPHLDGRFSRGIFFILIAAPAQTCILLTVAVLARTEHPLIIAYFWEASIILGSSLVLLIRYAVSRVPLQAISVSDFCEIALRSSPTVLGTCLFSMAAQLGPVGVIGAISTGELVLVSLLSSKLYGDKLSRMQWAVMLLIVIQIVAFKLLTEF